MILTNKILTAALCLLLPALGFAAEGDDKVIDLGKPVGENLRPDGFYWAFDDGLLGQTEPAITPDLSGNGFEGRISGDTKTAVPTYAEGKFGTAIYVQGFPQIRWTAKNALNSVAENAKLLAKNQPFTSGIWFKMDDRKPAGHLLIRLNPPKSGWRLGIYRETGETADSEATSWRLSVDFGESGGRLKSQASTSAFVDGQWHHVGFSFEPGMEGGPVTVVYWLDGELFDTVTASAVAEDGEPIDRFLSVGNGVWGLLDDAFVTSGIHTFKKN